MDPMTFAVLTFVILLALVLLGVPVALSIFAVSAGGMYFWVGDAFMSSMIRSVTYAASSNYAFAVVPMFILMGEIAGTSRIISDLYEACYRWIGHFRGGVYNATVLASTGFAAISGSTVVNAAVFTRVAMPEIDRLGLNRGFGAGCIAAAGTLAAMIPPSLTMVIYGILTGESIGAMLVAGILPGILTAIGLMTTVYICALTRTDLMPKTIETFTMRQKVAGLRQVFPSVVLAGIILAGIYSGTVSPSAAGTIGVAGALLISIAGRRLTMDGFLEALKRSVVTTASLFMIVIAGLIFSRLLLMTGAVTELTNVINGGGYSVGLFIAGVVVAYLVVGMFIDPVSLMVISIPLLYPTAKSLGVDPIWFGILIVKLVEIGAITPPIGINLFAVMSAAKPKLASREVFKGVLPFIVCESVVLSLLICFPIISTYLVKGMN